MRLNEVILILAGLLLIVIVVISLYRYHSDEELDQSVEADDLMGLEDRSISQ